MKLKIIRIHVYESYFDIKILLMLQQQKRLDMTNLLDMLYGLDWTFNFADVLFFCA